MVNDKPVSQNHQRAYTRKFAKIVGAKEIRKMEARRGGNRSIWFGLGMFGIVGWSVA
ncbi:MAG: AtpZ/AtpI family protein, partial [Desulfomonilaceae bacterium]